MAGHFGALPLVRQHVDCRARWNHLGADHIAVAMVVARDTGRISHAVCDWPYVQAGGVVADGFW